MYMWMIMDIDTYIDMYEYMHTQAVYCIRWCIYRQDTEIYPQRYRSDVRVDGHDIVGV